MGIPGLFYNEDPPSVGSPQLADTFPTRGKAESAGSNPSAKRKRREVRMPIIGFPLGGEAPRKR